MKTLLVSLLLLLPDSSLGFWSSQQSEDSKSKKQQEREVIEVNGGGTADGKKVEYGVDVSFPIHHETISTNYAWLPHNVQGLPTPDMYKDMPVNPVGDTKAAYEEFIQGCVKAFGSKGYRCQDTERDRIQMSLRQPQSMQNYTDIGFKKIRAPEHLFKMLTEFWETNKDNAKPEQWGAGNTYTNNWASPTEMVSVEDSRLRGGGARLKQQIWDAARDIISEWTGQELTQCSLYGIRRYNTGAILATHVDRLPLVSSAIINVAQDVDEPWPLEVYGHDGKAYNVTMLPGDMVLYESHSVLHGRPFPLKGRFMANIFIHFEPTGHSLRHNLKLEGKIDVEKQYREALERGQGGHEHDIDGLPSYILEGSPEEERWRQQHPRGTPRSKVKSFTTGSTSAHVLAQQGDVEGLLEEIKKDKSLVNARDENGWTPLVESARGGHLEAVKLLIEHGADTDLKTYHGGGTALWWAKKTHGEDHPVIEFLESVGALDAGPEL